MTSNHKLQPGQKLRWIVHHFFFGSNARYMQSFTLGSLVGFAVAALATASMERFGVAALQIAVVVTLIKESAFYLASSSAYSFLNRRGYQSRQEWVTDMKVLAGSCFAGALTANILRTIGHFVLMQTGVEGVVALFVSGVPVGLASASVKMIMDARKGIWLRVPHQRQR